MKSNDFKEFLMTKKFKIEIMICHDLKGIRVWNFIAMIVISSFKNQLRLI